MSIFIFLIASVVFSMFLCGKILKKE
jgi:hypothetical protein